MSGEEKKIIIDEDWKAQVEREKREAKEKVELEDTTGANEAEEESEQNYFLALVHNLITQTMLSLGLIAQPGTEEVYVNMDQAFYIIESLVALHEKTKGNLTEEEESQMTEAITEMQRVFALRSQQMQETTLNQPETNPHIIS